MYDQRDIVLVPFPYSDLTGLKQRPALIISNKKLNKTQDRICCLVTSKPSDNSIEIKDDFFEKGNLPFKSYIKSYRIFTINSKVIKKSLCRIKDQSYEEVLVKINDFIKNT